jgi:hypothetical protein
MLNEKRLATHRRNFAQLSRPPFESAKITDHLWASLSPNDGIVGFGAQLSFAPAVFRLVANYAACLLDREKRLIGSGLSLEGHAG